MTLLVMAVGFPRRCTIMAKLSARATVGSRTFLTRLSRQSHPRTVTTILCFGITGTPSNFRTTTDPGRPRKIWLLILALSVRYYSLMPIQSINTGCTAVYTTNGVDFQAVNSQLGIDPAGIQVELETLASPTQYQHPSASGLEEAPANETQPIDESEYTTDSETDEEGRGRIRVIPPWVRLLSTWSSPNLTGLFMGC
jgi:hypothetical protein